MPGNNKTQGKVKWFNEARGFGFIEIPGKPDLFVHYSDIEGRGFKTLKEGQSVNFHIEKGMKGLQAVDVSIVS